MCLPETKDGRGYENSHSVPVLNRMIQPLKTTLLEKKKVIHCFKQHPLAAYAGDVSLDKSDAPKNI